VKRGRVGASGLQSTSSQQAEVTGADRQQRCTTTIRLLVLGLVHVESPIVLCGGRDAQGPRAFTRANASGAHARPHQQHPFDNAHHRLQQTQLTVRSRPGARGETEAHPAHRTHAQGGSGSGRPPSSSTRGVDLWRQSPSPKSGMEHGAPPLQFFIFDMGRTGFWSGRSSESSWHALACFDPWWKEG